MLADPGVAPAGAAAPTFDHRPGLTHVRALAVVLVLLFHAGVVESGYIGVDVFFVLSGFLISNILWTKMASGTATRGRVLVEFYARRCLRILPLSLLVVAVTAVASHLFFDTLIDDWVAAARAALVWWENWFLIGQSNDYFASEGTNPFQHYWSLAIEEQFYVVLPLAITVLLLVLRPLSERAKLLALGVVASLGAVAGLASYRLFDLSESEFYYSSLTRSYQLLVGVAIMAFSRRFDLRDDRRWLCAVGVAGLIVVGALLTPSVITAGILATVFAVACVGSSRVHLVRSAWLDRLGLWSYGIYLWHFPINEYLIRERLDTPPWVAFAVTFAASTALAALSYRFFENPIRHAKLPPLATFAATALVIAALWLAVGRLATPAPAEVFVTGPGATEEKAALAIGADGRADLTTITPEGRVAADDVRLIEGWLPTKGTSIGSCGGEVDGLAGRCEDLQGSPMVLLIGDSFANRIYQALRPLAEENTWGLATFARPGCPWMDDVYNDTKDATSDRCKADKHLFDEVLAAVDPDVIVIHSYPYREANKALKRLSTDEPLSIDDVAEAATETVDRLVAEGHRVVYAQSTPFAEDGANAAECLKVAQWADQCDFDAVDVDTPLDRAMRTAAEDDPSVWYATIVDQYCDEGRCSAALGDLGTMGDSTHLSGGIWVKLRNVLRVPILEAAAAS